MTTSLATVSLLVHDYDEAIRFFTGALGFDLLEDKPLGGDKRCVIVAPPNSRGARLLLAQAVGDQQAARVGDQTGGRVGFFLQTDDFARDHAAFINKGVSFLEEARKESYGTVAVFADLYGNRWDLIEPRG